MFRLVLVMVLLVVQMVGGVGDAVVVRLRGGWEGGPVSRWFVRVVLLRAVRLSAGSVVGDALVVSACGSWS